jgi:hypothetical protein
VYGHWTRLQEIEEDRTEVRIYRGERCRRQVCTIIMPVNLAAPCPVHAAAAIALAPAWDTQIRTIGVHFNQAECPSSPRKAGWPGVGACVREALCLYTERANKDSLCALFALTFTSADNDREQYYYVLESRGSQEFQAERCVTASWYRKRWIQALYLESRCNLYTPACLFGVSRICSETSGVYYTLSW